MKKFMKRALVAVSAMAMVLSTMTIPAKAQSLEGRSANAYLAYADSSWTYQNWGTEDTENGVKVTPASVTGEGEYTVALDFTATEAGKAEGVAFSAVMIDNGTGLFPGATINVKEVKVNGETIEIGKGYTSSDDGKEIRFNLYNEWVSEIPSDARTADGDLEGITATPVSQDSFASVETVEVTFEVSKADTLAYIAYADPNWAVQYWGSDAEGVTATNAYVTGDGTYTVGLNFAEPVNGTAFTALMVNNLEQVAPNATLTLNEVKINGTAVDCGKFYTSSDDGVVTRVNLYNEWVSEIPSDARRADDDLADVSATPVSKDLFVDVTSYEVTFTVAGTTPTAYIMYADTDWAVQYWNSDAEGVVPTNALITGEGQYTVALDFTGSANGFANGCAFTALGIKNGENLFPGWTYTIDEVKINGEAVEVGKYFTSSDDKIESRVNLYNEWVAEVPAGARRSDSDLEGATAMPIDKEAFGEVKTIEVTFTAVWGAKPVEVEEAAEVIVEYSGEYGAYLGCQTNTELWIFRNAWAEENYGGINNPEVFAGLYDTTTEAAHPGTFTDAVITGDGTYTVSLTGADFGAEDYMSQLFVSTNLPYSSSVKFTDIHVSINGNEKYTCEEGHISDDDKKEGKYLAFFVQNMWDSQVTDLFAIQFPVTDIEITFTVEGLGYAAETQEVVAPVEEPVASVEASVEAPVVEEASAGVPAWVWAIVAVVIAGAVAATVVVSKKKKPEDK